MRTKMMTVPCALIRGGFSDERVFRLATPDGRDHVGVVGLVGAGLFDTACFTELECRFIALSANDLGGLGGQAHRQRSDQLRCVDQRRRVNQQRALQHVVAIKTLGGRQKTGG